jgi:predicted acylesterase/phospholipase RssA
MAGGFRPNTVTFSAGGVRVIGQMGILAGLLDTDVLRDVRAWYGCSGGAVCAFLGALGVTAAWIRDAIEHFDTRHIPDFRDEYITEFMTFWGLMPGDGYMQFLGRFVDTWEPGASDWTFADLARERPGVTLGLTATNLTRREQVCFSAATTPTVRILDAVRASGSIPILFTPWRSADGDLYGDGAFLEYYPWRCVADKEHTLVIVSEPNGVPGSGGTGVVHTPIATFQEYIRALMDVVVRRERGVGERPAHWISVKDEHVSAVDFAMPKSARLALFRCGEEAADAWLNTPPDAASASCARPPRSAHPDTLSSGHPLPDRTSGNLISQTPPSSAFPSPHPHTQSGRPDRRWSL